MALPTSIQSLLAKVRQIPASQALIELLGLMWGFISGLVNAQKVPVVAVSTTALPAYTRVGGVITANANGALANSVFDNVTLAVGQRVLVALGAALSDNGVYVITALGDSTHPFVLTTALDWATGSIHNGDTYAVQSGGTSYGNSSWKVMALNGTTDNDPITIGTTAVALYPKNYKQSIVLAAGTYTIGLGSTATPDEPLFLLAGATVSVLRTTSNTTTLTLEYAASTKTPGEGAVTFGPYTAAVLTIQAEVAAGTINVADLSTLDVTVTNW